MLFIISYIYIYINKMKTCKKGEIYRKGYKKNMKKTHKKIYVKGKCIKDRGKIGKWKDIHQEKGIGKLRKGDLTKYGYQNVIQLSTEKRKKILKKCVEEYGPISIFRKLNAVYIYNKNTNPKISEIFKRDRDWIRKKYMKP